MASLQMYSEQRKKHALIEEFLEKQEEEMTNVSKVKHDGSMDI